MCVCVCVCVCVFVCAHACTLGAYDCMYVCVGGEGGGGEVVFGFVKGVYGCN